MRRLKNQRRVNVLFYVLVGYICLQFSWWAYLLIDLMKAHYAPNGAEVVSSKIWMIIGEGGVFLILLCVGLFIMQRAISREIGMARQQRNFLLSVTHELKTPLSGIKLAIQTLQKRGDLSPEKRLEVESNALANTERLHALIDNVLLAARIERGEIPPVAEDLDLSELTNTLVDPYRSSQAVVTDIAPDLWVETDKQAYTSIVINLLDNAVKYGGGGEVRVSLRPDGKNVLLVVGDSGPGITEGEEARIFDMFYRSGNEDTRKRKGTGLGLYIVRELTTALGGRVSVANEKEGGATFAVLLPRTVSE